MVNELDKHINAYNNDFAYALDNNLMLNWYPKRIIKKGIGNSILELGIGHGYTSLLFSDYVKKHVIIEGSSLVIDKFLSENKTREHLHITNTYFEEFSTNEKFDAIIMGFVLEHVDNPYLILSKFKEFLKPNGKCYIAVPNGTALNKRIGFAAGLITDMKALTKADYELGHKRIYDVASISDEVIRSGYKIISTEGIFLKAITTEQMLKLNFSNEILQGMLEVGIDYPELCAAVLIEAEVA